VGVLENRDRDRKDRMEEARIFSEEVKLGENNEEDLRTSCGTDHFYPQSGIGELFLEGDVRRQRRRRPPEKGNTGKQVQISEFGLWKLLEGGVL